MDVIVNTCSEMVKLVTTVQRAHQIAAKTYDTSVTRSQKNTPETPVKYADALTNSDVALMMYSSTSCPEHYMVWRLPL